MNKAGLVFTKAPPVWKQVALSSQLLEVQALLFCTTLDVKQFLHRGPFSSVVISGWVKDRKSGSWKRYEHVERDSAV